MGKKPLPSGETVRILGLIYRTAKTRGGRTGIEITNRKEIWAIRLRNEDVRPYCPPQPPPKNNHTP